MRSAHGWGRLKDPSLKHKLVWNNKAIAEGSLAVQLLYDG